MRKGGWSEPPRVKKASRAGLRNGAPRYDTIHVGAGSASAPLCSRLAPSVDAAAVVVVGGGGCAAAAPGLASSPPLASWSPADGPAWFLAACGGAFLRWRLLLAGPFDPLAASRSRSPPPPPRAFPAARPFWRSRCSTSSLRAFSNAAPSAVFCAAPPAPPRRAAPRAWFVARTLSERESRPPSCARFASASAKISTSTNPHVQQTAPLASASPACRVQARPQLLHVHSCATATAAAAGGGRSGCPAVVTTPG
jgi:hypothetical protein